MAVRKTKVADTIATAIAARISAGEYPVGEAIPSLKRLAEEFEVSSLTVREAIASLEAHGLLASKHGSGTYVLARSERRRRDPWIITPEEHDEYVELIEARQYIESAITELAAQRCTPEQLQRLEAILADMEAARTDPVAYMESDYEFHLALAEASGNRVLLQAMLAIRGPLRRFMAARSVSDCQKDGNLDRSIADHRAILQGIASQDLRKATRGLRAIEKRAQAHVGIFERSS